MPDYVLLDDRESPQVVREMLARLGDSLPNGLLRAYEREFKLSYYFGGLCAVVAETARGPAIYASGTDEDVDARLGERGVDFPKALLWLRPDALEEVIADLPPARQAAAVVRQAG